MRTAANVAPLFTIANHFKRGKSENKHRFLSDFSKKSAKKEKIRAIRSENLHQRML